MQRFRIAMRLLFLTLIVAIPTLAQATSLPPATYSGDGSAAGPTTLPLTAPGTWHEGGGFGLTGSEANVTLVATPDPSVSVGASANLDQASAHGSIFYYMDITGGIGVSPVIVDVAGAVSASSSADSVAAAGLLIELGSGLFSIVQSWTACADALFPVSCAGSPTMVTVNAQQQLSSNTLYVVGLSAAAAVPVGPPFEPIGALGIGAAGAFVDPSFGIDPATPNASAFSIVFSDGIGNAGPGPGSASMPEPATLTMLVMGIVIVGALRARGSGTRRA